MRGFVDAYLDEANVGGLLTEALTADVQAVLADETSLVGADAAVEKWIVSQMFSPSIVVPSLEVRAHDTSMVLLFLLDSSSSSSKRRGS